ncbi:MAG: alpha/beta hydrolase [Myxococcota bacterium]|nr:alpha/beta hydrolase [Myxococcota bacterium]
MKRVGLRVISLCVAFVLTTMLTLEVRPDWFMQAHENWLRGLAGFEEKHMEVSEHHIRYLEGGAGETILLIHGFGGDKDHWTRLARHLTDDYRVIAIDLPGFGESSRHDQLSYDILSQVDRVYHIYQRLDLSTVHLVGNSRGGQIATHFAALYPELVKTLTIVNARGVSAPVPSDLDQILETGRHPLMVKDVDEFGKVLDWLFVDKPYVPAAILTHLAELSIEKQRFQEKVFSDQQVRPAPLEDVLAKIRTPTLIVWGDGDRIIDPSTAEVFRRGIAGSRLVMLHACGHLPQLEQPEKLADLMLNHLGLTQP